MIGGGPAAAGGIGGALQWMIGGAPATAGGIGRALPRMIGGAPAARGRDWRGPAADDLGSPVLYIPTLLGFPIL